MRRKALKKTCAAHLFFQRQTTHPREIFFISKITVENLLSSCLYVSQISSFKLDLGPYSPTKSQEYSLFFLQDFVSLKITPIMIG